MFRVKIGGCVRYGWSYVVYIDGSYVGSGDFFDTLSDAIDRVNSILLYNGLI
jgi:hypothetical protein